MTFAPVAPEVHFGPREIAADTWLIQSVQPALGEPLFVYLNSLVILAEEPVIVDTGTSVDVDAVVSSAQEHTKIVFLCSPNNPTGGSIPLAAAAALAENFSGQWLETRNLDSVNPDPEMFPAWGPALRDAMKTETAPTGSKSSMVVMRRLTCRDIISPTIPRN